MFLLMCLPIFLSLFLPSCLLLFDKHMLSQTSPTNPTPPPLHKPLSDTTSTISPEEIFSSSSTTPYSAFTSTSLNEKPPSSLSHLTPTWMITHPVELSLLTQSFLTTSLFTTSNNSFGCSITHDSPYMTTPPTTGGL